MKYAGFWRRFIALSLDTLVLILPGVLFDQLQLTSRLLAFILLVPSVFLSPLYDTYFHGRWGQTLGKMSVGIRVASLDGARISWKQAILRSSVDICFAVTALVSQLIALTHISSGEFSSLSRMELSRRITELTPDSKVLLIAGLVWGWSEIIVMLFNRRRRALHDFIAGTVVVVESSQTIEDSTAIAMQPNNSFNPTAQ